MKCKKGSWKVKEARADPGAPPCEDNPDISCVDNEGQCNQFTEKGNEMERDCPGTCGHSTNNQNCVHFNSIFLQSHVTAVGAVTMPTGTCIAPFGSLIVRIQGKSSGFLKFNALFSIYLFKLHSLIFCDITLTFHVQSPGHVDDNQL